LERGEYTSWEVGANLNFLWLIGAPGIGKTVISCFIVEKLQHLLLESQSMILAHYFCDNKDKDRNTAVPILRSIVAQLLKQKPELFAFIKDDYELKKSAITGSLESLWAPLVRMLKNCQDEEVYVLIDAIDECEETSRKKIMGLFKELDASSKARILITGRPETDIEEKAKFLGQILRLDSGKINTDLTKFIDIKVSEVQAEKSYPETLIQDITAMLKDKHGGTFLWAALVLKDITAAKTTKAARKKLKDLRSDLPADLPDVYDRILKNITEEAEDAVFILQRLVVSRKPMTVIELATVQALASEDWNGKTVPPPELVEELKDSFKSCGALVYHDLQDDTINLIHQSVKDYLIKDGCLPDYRVNVEEIKLSMLNTCWKYLSLPEFHHGTIIVGRKDADKVFIRSLSKRLLWTYGFLGYAFESLLGSGFNEWNDNIIEFLYQCQNLDALPCFLDIWLSRFSAMDKLEIVRFLIDHKVDINAKHGNDETTLLHRTAESGYEAMVKLLLGSGSDVMSRDKFGNTALHLAAEKGFVNICRSLIKGGVDINAKMGEYSLTALHLAVRSIRKEIVSLLVEHGVNLEEEDALGNTAFWDSVEKTSEPIALHLWQKGAKSKIEGNRLISWDRQGGWNGKGGWKGSGKESVLIKAAGKGCYEVAKLLLQNDIDVNAKGREDTVLSAAVKNGDEAMVRLFINAGADITLMSGYDNEENLLHLAAKGGHHEIALLLVQNGFDVKDPRVEEESTPLHCAVNEGYPKVFDVLVRAGANLAVRAENGATLLHLAAKRGHESIVSRLLGMTTDADQITKLEETGSQDVIGDCQSETFKSHFKNATEVRDNTGKTPLHYAIDEGSRGTAVLLLKGGADVIATDNDGLTPLHIISEWKKLPYRPRRRDGERRRVLSVRERKLRSKKVVNFLLENGADINAITLNGSTPLHLAIASRKFNTVGILLQHGANVNIVDNHGLTPLHYFASHPDDLSERSIVHTLLNYGAKIDARDNNGRTALFLAAKKHNPDLCSILIRNGADSRAMSDVTEALDTFPKTKSLIEAAELWRSALAVAQHINQYGNRGTYAGIDTLGFSDRVSNKDENPSIDGIRIYDENDERDGDESDDDDIYRYDIYRYDECNLADDRYAYFGDRDDDSEEEEDRVTKLVASCEKEFLDLLFEKAAYSVILMEPAGIKLRKAVEGGYRDLVSATLANDTESPISDKVKASAFHQAIRRGDEEMVRAMMENGVEIEPEDIDCGSALEVAAGAGHDHIVKLFLQNGADVHRKSGAWTPLLTAACHGHANILEILLDAGADISDSNWKGTALYCAIENGYIEAVRVLVSRGAAINSYSSSRKSTPLHDAVTRGNEAMVKLILESGADVNAIDRDGWTPLDTALDGVGTRKVVILLFQYGAKSGTGLNGSEPFRKPKYTLLSWAMRTGIKAIMDLLELHLDCFDLQGRECQHLLTWAVEREYHDLVSRLQEKGVRMNVDAFDAMVLE
jgi:ankyrin repeat protein